MRSLERFFYLKNMDKKPVKKITIKKDQVAKLAEKIAKSKAIAFVDYHGLNAKQIGDLREKVKDASGELVIIKNTLLSRALQSTHYPLPASPAKRGEPTTNYQLTGPTATIIAFKDEIAPIRVVWENAKVSGFPKLKLGLFGKKMLDAQSLNTLASLPNREILQAKVIGALASPIYGLVNVLGANIRNLVLVLDQAAKKRA